MASRSYTTASQRLLRYAEINKDDTAFAREGEIVYIFDTSAVEAYWTRNPKSSSGQFGTDGLLLPKVATYSGWLALKFLVEHKLPGQRGRVGYLSPNHWNEALSRVEEAQNRIRAEMAEAAASYATKADENSATLEEALQVLSNIGPQPQKLLKAAEDRNLGKTFTTIMEAVSTGERVRRIFRNGRGGEPSVRDLTLCSFYHEITGPKMRHQDFRRWYASIARHRSESDAGHGKKGASSKRTESDAITLASIQMMYRSNPHSTGSRAAVRFVFVTADHTLHSAFEDMEDYLLDEDIPIFIRHPHVYAPLLNHATMATQVTTTAQYQELKAVIDRVEEALGPLSVDFWPGSSLAEAYDIRLKHNIQVWSRLVETLCLSNSHYVLSDLSGEYAPARSLARILSATDVRVAAANAVGADIHEIRDAHLQMMSVLALETIERAHADRQKGQGGDQGPHRAPVKLIGIDIAGVLGYPQIGQAAHAAWLDNFLTTFRQGATDGKIVESMRKYWDDGKSAPAVQLLACCIFFAVNAWDSARLCAKLCQASLKSRPDRKIWIREAKYCEALAIRMQLQTASDIALATGHLNRNMADSADATAASRDKIERATLTLTAALVQTIEEGLELTDKQTPFLGLIGHDELAGDVADALSDLEDVIADFSRKYQTIDETEQRILLQAQVNKLGACIFSAILGDPLPSELGEHAQMSAARQALETIIKRYSIEPSTTAEIYLAASAAILEPSIAKFEECLNLLNSIDPKSLNLSRADNREVKFLIRHFEGSKAAQASVV